MSFGFVRLWKALEATSPRGTLGVVADALGVLSALGGAYVLVTGDDLPRAILATTLGLLAVVFIALSFRLQVVIGDRNTALALSGEQYRRHMQAAKAMPLLSTAAAHAARATVVAATRPGEFILHLNNACTALAEMYSVATGNPCRVSVLELYAPQGQRRRPTVDASESEPTGVAVRLLCANYTDRPVRDQIDWVVDNTDFDTIFVTGRKYFMCNDLPSEVGRGYRNSHWTREKIEEFRAQDAWPYRSTIVWPIGSVPTGVVEGERDLVGFLCVDAVELDTFDKDFDVPTGETLAHAVYSGMATYRAAQRRAVSATKQESSEK